MCKPFLIRNWSTGAEFELNDKDRFDAVYGSDPAWYIATGEHSAVAQEALAAQAMVNEGSPPEFDGDAVTPPDMSPPEQDVTPIDGESDQV